MKANFPPNPLGAAGGHVLDWTRSVVESWNRFWFTPADPTILGVMRIGCGLLALFTLLTYTPELQNFFGRQAWYDQESALRDVREVPWFTLPLTTWGPPVVDTAPRNKAQELYKEYYTKKWQRPLPLPYPEGLEDTYRRLYNQLGKEPTGKQLAEVNGMARFYDDYLEYWGVEYRTAFAHGTPQWSVWFHVTDPVVMALVHWGFILVTFLFLIGFCTRFTSVLAWFAALNYIHRSSTSLFGVDTMMIITMGYLVIGPAGATLSVDRWLARWWRGIRHQFGFGSAASGATLVRPEADPPAPSVTANLAIRLMQIHLCIIYAAAGFAKLKGNSWWTGLAIWGTLANSEFAPLQNPVYAYFLQFLCWNPLLLYAFLLVGTYFTLFFEICYPFLIWNRRTRWLILGMGLVLHGGIGLLMGLRTFAFAMLVMNLVFVPTPTVHWLLGLFRGKRTPVQADEPPRSRPEKKEPVEVGITAPAGSPEKTGVLQTHVKRKK